MTDIFKGATSNSVFVELVDSTTGLPKTGIVYTDVTGSYIRTRSARVAITMATLASASASFSSGGFILVDDTNQPGVYRVDVSDAAFVTGVPEVVVTLKATGCRTVSRAFNLVDVNNQVAYAPNVAAGGVGGLLTAPTTANTGLANVTQFGGTNLTSASGIPEVKVASIANNAITAAAIQDAAIDTATFATGATLPRVTLVDTCTTNSDMRGTDGANTTSPPTVGAIADAVWDEARAGHTTAGTFGFYLDAAITGISAGSGATAQQVWEYATRTLTGAVELDPAVETQITAIETFATRMTTGIAQDGAVWQFTANMLELGPSGGGGSSVNVLPATGIVSDRSAGTTLLPVVGETISQSITVYQSDGTTAVSLSGKTLKVIFETMSGADVAVVLAADITISGASSNVVTFAYPSAVTASERTLRFAIRDAAAPLTMYLQGVCSVVAAPKVDA